MVGLRRGTGATESRAPAEWERIEERDRSRTGGEPAEFAETPDESGDEDGDERGDESGDESSDEEGDRGVPRGKGAGRGAKFPTRTEPRGFAPGPGSPGPGTWNLRPVRGS